MFFITIFTTLTLSQIMCIENQQIANNISEIQNLNPIVFEDKLIPNNKIVYNKVPTNLIKIDKNSN